MRKITGYIDKLTSISNSPTQTRAHHQISPPYPSTTPSFPTTRHGSSTSRHSRSKGSLIGHARRWIRKNITKRRRCLIDMLPDNVLLSIFDFSVNENQPVNGWPQQVWQTLVHVCPRWRYLVFESPRSLNLQLICTSRTPAKDMLDIWPPLPLVIDSDVSPIKNVDNIVAALEHRNRVRHIDIDGISSSDLEKVLATMQEPFPELTTLILSSGEKPMAVLPDSFLGGSALGSAPRLRELRFYDIPFPGLPKLLSSATHLTDLHLSNIPHSGYFSPEAMATALSTLTSLDRLFLGFHSPLSLPNRASRGLPPPIHFILPVLNYIGFKGVSEYVDDLLARIDAPQLVELNLIFFNQILFDTPQLVQFINRTSAFKTPEQAHVYFMDDAARVGLLSRGSDYAGLGIRIRCKKSDWQVSSLEQVSTWCLPPFSALEDLHISGSTYRLDWQDNIENSLWLELFQPFSAVKNLYLSKEFVPRIMPSLQELVEERTTEVLPSLQNIFLEGLESSGAVHEGIQKFVAKRQASHPITISRWDRGRV